MKLLNSPQPVSVRTGPDGCRPVAVRIPAPVRALGARRSQRPDAGTWQEVIEVEDVWKINDEWWRGPGEAIERMYFNLLLESGQRLVVFHDMARNEWRRQAG